MSSDRPLHVAVVGAGRMGRHHARTYRKLPNTQLLAVVDINPDRAQEAAEEFACQAFSSVQELLQQLPQLDAVSIAVPTAQHLSAARPFLQRRIPCLIEKPLASSLPEAQELAELARLHQTILAVGHTERFNPAVRAVAAMKIRPRFVQVDRVSPMTFRSLDVGVVMDLMIHDLDILLMLVGQPVQNVQAVGVAVLGRHEDIANARITFQDGCVANLTASRLALKTERKMRLFSEDAYVSLDYQARRGIAIRRKEENLQVLAEVRRKLQEGADLSDLDYTRLVSIDELNMDLPDGQEDPLTAELSAFLQAVRTASPPPVDAQAALAAIAVADQIQRAIATHRWEGLPAHPLEILGDEA